MNIERVLEKGTHWRKDPSELRKALPAIWSTILFSVFWNKPNFSMIIFPVSENNCGVYSESSLPLTNPLDHLDVSKLMCL